MAAGVALLRIADELYALPLAEFTPLRDSRAKQVKGDDADLAKQVKSLRKPSLAAWVVNLLVRVDAEQVEQVLTVGAALREAQAALAGDQLRVEQHQQTVAGVLGGDVHDEQPQVEADLRGGHTYAGTGPQGVDQIVDHFAQAGPVEVDLTAALFENRIGVENDRTDGQFRAIPFPACAG
mgnify:CR=1 FL=1